MLEVIVFSKRIVEKTMDGSGQLLPDKIKGIDIYHSLNRRTGSEAVSIPSLSALQQTLWDKVGVIRNRENLTQAADILSLWHNNIPPPTDRPSYELNNLILAGRLVTEAALLREESRGAHFRTDFPQSSPDWQRHIVFNAGQKGI